MNASVVSRIVRSMPAEGVVAYIAERAARPVVTTSFGIQSAVLLDIVRRVEPQMAVIWVDTGYLPPETHEYAATLSRVLGLNLVVARSEMSPEEMERRYGRLWESDDVADLDRYDAIRKVEPLQRALATLGADAWLAGVRAAQTDTRRTLPHAVTQFGVVKVHPLLRWSDQAVEAYMDAHHLPHHPLEARGYRSVGDAHSSRPMRATDTDARATRFGGRKQECGLHRPTPARVRVTQLASARATT